MSTISQFNESNISITNPIISRFRTIVETAFYRNNVIKVTSRREAYKLAKNSPGTITLSWKVYMPHLLDLDDDSHVLLFNDGGVTGRYALGRRILSDPDIDKDFYLKILMEAVYNSRHKKMYHAVSFTGLDEDFMVKNHILIPENHENLLYNWLLNFQHETPEYRVLYENSKKFYEGDIYIFSDPDWKHPDFPMGLVLFDPEHNSAAILGMRYFGEFKKATLTLGWGIANRNGYVACHGGLKLFELGDSRKFTAAFFGLSGSGKSTLTHAKHGGKYKITVLHDDAFIINLKDGSSIALEPQYFDKTSDYTTNSEDNKYLLTIQNCGATMNTKGEIVPILEDVRNGNGRAIKSRLWSPNRKDKIKHPINAIFWIMKDPVLPPLVKVENPILASTMGATLATMRTSAEAGVDTTKLVIEPYANPFRTWPLKDDFLKFKSLFEKGVECYILNTGYFLNKKVHKELTLSLIESVIERSVELKDFVHGLKIAHIKGYVPDLSDENYLKKFIESIKLRMEFIESKKDLRGGVDALPKESFESLSLLLSDIKKLIKK